jgi:hypothetical protein
MTTNRFNIYALISLLALTVAGGGCKKFLEVDPSKTEVPTGQVFSSDQNAQLAIAGLYTGLKNAFHFNTTLLPAFSADELTYFVSDVNYDPIQADNVNVTNSATQSLWDDFYSAIYNANSIIENAQASTGMSDAFKTQIIGEAKFFRAFSHFYLVNIFGKVPLVTTTDVTRTMYLSRTSVDSVYQQIEADLKDAMNVLPGDYSISGGERIRVNKWAAVALLARVYLYTKDWVDAEAMSTAVMGSSNYALQTSANIGMVFKEDNSEAILQLQRSVGNTYEGGSFLDYYYYYGYFNYYIQPGLLAAFEPGDLRKSTWVLTATYSNYGGSGTFSTPFKYQRYTYTPADEYYMFLRLGEQYLIRAEARAQQNNVSGAQADINAIRNRAGLGNTTATDQPSLLAAIEQERRVELFCEWGHRWFDLKRWPSLTSPATKTRADDVLGALKSTWTSTAILYPIPVTAMAANPYLVQNPGY